MSLKVWGILIPLFLMIVATLLNAGSVSGTSTLAFQNSVPSGGGSGAGSQTCTQAYTTALLSRTPCFSSLPTSGSIVCIVSGSPNTPLTDLNNYCLLAPGCGTFNNPQVGCVHNTSGSYFTVASNGATIFLAGSASGNGVITNSTPAAAGAFSITSDWTVVIVGLMALAILASITVFTIGLNAAAVRIMFIVGGLLVIWGVLTVASGFGSSTSMWGQLDILKSANGQQMFLGSALFGLSSLFYTLSAIMWTTGQGE